MKSPLYKSVAAFSVHPHLVAYLHQRDPRHIAAAWVAFREHKVPPDESLLLWIDQLARDVIDPTAPGVRTKDPAIAVRDLEIYRLYHALRQRNVRDKESGRLRPMSYREAIKALCEQFALTATNIKKILSHVEASLADPGRAPRAFRKPTKS